MLEHQKFILANLSQVKPLFKKELIKSIGWLKPEEVMELHRWVMKNYMHTHREIISEVFMPTPGINRDATS
ncbi:MAG: hypothetical protein ACOCXH_03355 [Cyclobacteriaceae bacterium]